MFEILTGMDIECSARADIPMSAAGSSEFKCLRGVVPINVTTVPNPLKLLILGLGAVLSRAGLVDQDRVRRTVDLAWPRIVTGLSRTLLRNVANSSQ